MKTILSTFLISLLLFSCSPKADVADAFGNFESDEVVVSAMGTGELIRFTAQEGDELTNGQVVGLVDTTDLSIKKRQLLQQQKTIKSQLNNIAAELDVQQQLIDNNKINQHRTKKLFDAGAATQKQLDDINGLVNLNEKQLIAIHSKKQNILDQIVSVGLQVDQINESLDKCIITNPVEGTVQVLYAQQGEFASTGKPLYQIANLSILKLKAYISGSQLSEVEIGQHVEVLYDTGKNSMGSLPGIVTWISSSAEFTPKTIQTKEERVNLVYAIKIEVHNNGALRIGMPGEVIFSKQTNSISNQ